jgi:hypothetical protein
MRAAGMAFRVLLAVAIVAPQSLAGPFVLFPKVKKLASPDGRFVVRNSEAEARGADFVGAFRSLWLTETATRRSRKLCDYVGVAAVAWSKNDFLVITQYLNKRTSRALLISANDSQDTVMLDVRTLIQLVPAESRAALRENDHVFVEASHVEAETLYLWVWGYGKHDPKGFRWRCEYSLGEGKITCDGSDESK